MQFEVIDESEYLATQAAAILKQWADSSTEPANNDQSGGLQIQLSNIVVGSSDDRMGPSLSSAGVKAIREQIAEFVRANEPIRLHVMWGGLKHYVDLTEQDIDASELYALIQFRRLHQSVKALYEPGINVCFYLEDFGVAYEDAEGREKATFDLVWSGIKKYCARFEDLVATIGSSFAICKRFNEVCPRERWGEMSSRADSNLVALRSAWRACQRDDVEGSKEARQILDSIQWSGDIPDVMRTHYLARLASLYPEEPTNEHIERLLRYFAIVTLYQQTGIYRPTRPSIKFAMYKPSPGIPEERVRERLHMRTISSKFCTQTMPPWTSLGCFAVSNDQPPAMKLRSRKVLDQQKVATREIELIVSEGGKSISIKSKIIGTHSPFQKS